MQEAIIDSFAGGGGASTGWTHGAPAATAADLTLSSYKRALLVACFGRWGDRLAYRRQLGVEREGAEARLAAGRWEAEAVAERATTAQLRAALDELDKSTAAPRKELGETVAAVASSDEAKAIVAAAQQAATAAAPVLQEAAQQVAPGAAAAASELRGAASKALVEAAATVELLAK